MNMIKNDRGELVLSVGAEGSLVRVYNIYPELIERINTIYDREAPIHLAYKIAITVIKNRGASEHADKLLFLSKFRDYKPAI